MSLSSEMTSNRQKNKPPVGTKNNNPLWLTGGLPQGVVEITL